VGQDDDVFAAAGGGRVQLLAAEADPAEVVAYHISHAEHPPLETAGGVRGETIPACAGSTGKSRSCHATGGDHPRVRGEHETERTATERARGPSPRARGAQAPPHRVAG